MEWDGDFTTFVREHTDVLFRSAVALTGDSSSAADLVQDTLAQLYPKWQRVQAADSDIAYVRKSLLNRFVSNTRRRRKETLVAEVPDRADASSPHGAWLDADDVVGQLGLLPARQRGALVLRYLLDLDDEAGAAALGCPVSTFRSLNRRGLLKLRSLRQVDLEFPATGVSRLGTAQ